MNSSFRLHTTSGEEIFIPEGAPISLIVDNEVMVLRTDLYLDQVDLTVTSDQDLAGLPEMGTTTGSSSPTMSSTSSPGNGLPCASIAQPGIDESGVTFTGTSNGSRTNCRGYVNDSISTGAGVEFRSRNCVCDCHSMERRLGDSAEAIDSMPVADRAAEDAWSSSAAATCAARSAWSCAACTSADMRSASAWASVRRSIESFFASLRAAIHAHREPTAPSTLTTAGTASAHVTPSPMSSSSVGGDGASVAPSGSGASEPTEEAPAGTGPADATRQGTTVQHLVADHGVEHQIAIVRDEDGELRTVETGRVHWDANGRHEVDAEPTVQDAYGFDLLRAPCTISSEVLESLIEEGSGAGGDEVSVADGAHTEPSNLVRRLDALEESLAKLGDLVLKRDERLDKHLALDPVYESDLLYLARVSSERGRPVKLSEDGGANRKTIRVEAVSPGSPHDSSSVGGDDAPVTSSGSGASEPTEEAPRSAGSRSSGPAEHDREALR